MTPNTPATSNNTKPLITYAQLVENPEEVIKRDQLNSLLNKPPREEWLKKHPTAKDVKYLPIDKVEWLMRAIFQRYRREILSVQQILNSVQVTVRVHYLDPTTNEWDWQDGVGAAPIQMDSGASATNLNAIKHNAIQIAVPSAASYAFKDACENIGNIFGANLNRKNTIAFAPLYEGALSGETTQTTPATKQEEVVEDITNNF